MNDDPTWDFLNPASKGRPLALLADQAGEMLELLAAPGNWEAPTACPRWEVRDMAGHLVDTTIQGDPEAFARFRALSVAI